jgi:hypothetical protein
VDPNEALAQAREAVKVLQGSVTRRVTRHAAEERLVAGSHRMTCSGCACKVWVSPNSWADLHAYTAAGGGAVWLLCGDCALARLREARDAGEQVDWPAMPLTERAIEAEAQRRRHEPPV